VLAAAVVEDAVAMTLVLSAMTVALVEVEEEETAEVT